MYWNEYSVSTVFYSLHTIRLMNTSILWTLSWDPSIENCILFCYIEGKNRTAILIIYVDYTLEIGDEPQLFNILECINI